MNAGGPEWSEARDPDFRSRRLVWVIAGLQARQGPLFNVAAARTNRASPRRTAEFNLARVLTHEFKLLVTGVVRFESGGLFVS